MTAPVNNLFLRLHKWASRQDENFLTESLAIVLEQLLVLAPAVGTRLVARLTGDFIKETAETASAIEILPQVETGSGRPDLEIRTVDRLVWVEVKAESELRTGQLEGYRILPNGSDIKQTRLILLTRYAELFQTEDEHPDLQVQWFELADWLMDEVPEAQAAGDVAGFLAQQFLDFLEARGMKLAQVGKYMPEGTRALSNLMNMLVEAASACKVSIKKMHGWDYLGIQMDERKYEVAVWFAEPEKLWFGTRCQIDLEAARKLTDGELKEDRGKPGGFRWEKGVELDSEDIHFYSRSKVGQMQWLVDFLRESMSRVRSIETPGQPPLPEEPQEE